MRERIEPFRRVMCIGPEKLWLGLAAGDTDEKVAS
jgi:hypothetical protein